MVPIWQLLCPTYGNFGGPGWSGGRYIDTYADVDWSVQAKDSLDELFRRHDLAYQSAIRDYDRKITDLTERNAAWKAADVVLVASLGELPAESAEWTLKPKTPWYAEFYRRAAKFVFSVKIRLT
jgi:hypothetical protein